MNEPLITIVVPVHKVPKDMLHKCLNSIVAQTSNNYEALLVDDGSPDDCGDICDTYAKEYSNFRVLHQENGGLSVARNTGIRNARGEWVCFVDGDDWIESDTVAFAEQYIKDCSDGDVLIWDEYYDMPNARYRNYFLGDETKGTLVFTSDKKEKLLDLIIQVKYEKNSKVFADIGNCHARVYNVDFLQGNNLYNVPGLKRMQDNVFTLWVFEKASKIYYKCKHLYHYNFNEDAATKKYAKDICDSMSAVYAQMIDFAIQTGKGEEFKQRIYTRFSRIFLKIIELKHANPNNPAKFSARIKDMKSDFSNSQFSDIIQNIDLKGQAGRVKLCVILLRRKAYVVLYVIVKGIVGSRNWRYKLSQRKNVRSKLCD